MISSSIRSSKEVERVGGLVKQKQPRSGSETILPVSPPTFKPPPCSFPQRVGVQHGSDMQGIELEEWQGRTDDQNQQVNAFH